MVRTAYTSALSHESKTFVTHVRDSLRHLQPGDNNGQATAGDRGDGNLVLDIRRLRADVCGVRSSLSPFTQKKHTQNAHVVQLVQHLGLLLLTERVLGGQQRYPVDEGTQRAAELVVSARQLCRACKMCSELTCDSPLGPGCDTCASP